MTLSRLLRLMLLLTACNCSLLCNSEDKPSGPTAPAAKQRQPKQKRRYAVDFSKVRKEYITKVRRGEISLPNPDFLPMNVRLMGAETEAVQAWVRNSAVDDVGLLPTFRIRIEQIIDETHAVVDGGGDERIWLSGFETKQWREQNDAMIPSAVVKIGTQKYHTVAGAAGTARSLVLQELAEQKRDMYKPSAK